MDFFCAFERIFEGNREIFAATDVVGHPLFLVVKTAPVVVILLDYLAVIVLVLKAEFFWNKARLGPWRHVDCSVLNQDIEASVAKRFLDDNTLVLEHFGWVILAYSANPDLGSLQRNQHLCLVQAFIVNGLACLDVHPDKCHDYQIEQCSHFFVFALN